MIMNTSDEVFPCSQREHCGAYCRCETFMTTSPQLNVC